MEYEMRHNLFKFAVGLFVLIGVITLIALSIWLGISKSKAKGNFYLAFFDESVQGLSKDSPVKFRGVPVGKVQSIDVAPDSRLIQVTLVIDKTMQIGPDIVAKLSPVGLTGAVFVELNVATEKDLIPRKELSFPTEYPVIPSKPSDISTIFKGIDDLINQIKNLPLDEISTNLNATLVKIKDAVEDPELKQAIKSLKNALSSIEKELSSQPMKNMLSTLEKANTSFQSSMTNLSEAVNEYKKTAVALNDLLTDKDKGFAPLIQELHNTVNRVQMLTTKLEKTLDRNSIGLSASATNFEVLTQELNRTLNNLNGLLELFQEQPAGFLFGKEKNNEK